MAGRTGKGKVLSRKSDGKKKREQIEEREKEEEEDKEKDISMERVNFSMREK